MRFRCLVIALLVSILSGLASVPSAQALTGSVAYPLSLCQARLVSASTSSNQPTQGTIALSLGGAPATADECFNDGYTNSGLAVSTGGSASSSISAIALTSCYSIGDFGAVVGGGVTHCGRGFLANVSIFSNSFGSSGSLVSFSLLGDASGSFLAIAPFGSAYGNAALGCRAAVGSSGVWWRWCSAWESALTPAQQQAVYTTLQSLAQLGLVETQAVLNFYNDNVSSLSTTMPVDGGRRHADDICEPVAHYTALNLFITKYDCIDVVSGDAYSYFDIAPV